MWKRENQRRSLRCWPGKCDPTVSRHNRQTRKCRQERGTGRQPTHGVRSAGRGQGLDDASCQKGSRCQCPAARQPHLDILRVQVHRATRRVKGRVHTRTPKGHRSAGSSGSVPVVRDYKGGHVWGFRLSVPLLPVSHLRTSQSLSLPLSASLLLSLSLSVCLSPSFLAHWLTRGHVMNGLWNNPPG